MSEKEFTPKFKQFFYVLAELKDRCFYKSHNETHLFTVPLITDANFFINRELAERYLNTHKLKAFIIVKVMPNYFKNE